LDTTSLEKLKQTEEIAFMNDGIIVAVKDSWIVKGEDRLSYTTLIRLIECCREYHWQNDIVPVALGNALDSICKSITCNFISPITVGSRVFIKYQITNVREKSYALKFELFQTGSNKLCAECILVSVFYDSVSKKSTLPSDAIIDKLTDMCHGRGR